MYHTYMYLVGFDDDDPVNVKKNHGLNYILINTDDKGQVDKLLATKKNAQLIVKENE